MGVSVSGIGLADWWSSATGSRIGIGWRVAQSVQRKARLSEAQISSALSGLQSKASTASATRSVVERPDRARLPT